MLTIYFSMNFQEYVEDNNGIHVENGILKSIRHIGGNYDTKAVLADAGNIFGRKVLKKINIKIKTGAQETHEVFLQKYLVKVTKSSNVSVQEIIQLNKLQRYANNDLFVNVATINK